MQFSKSQDFIVGRHNSAALVWRRTPFACARRCGPAGAHRHPPSPAPRNCRTRSCQRYARNANGSRRAKKRGIRKMELGTKLTEPGTKPTEPGKKSDITGPVTGRKGNGSRDEILCPCGDQIELVPLHRGFDGLKFNEGLGGPRARPESQCCARRPGCA
jgi:hypothetical protein